MRCRQKIIANQASFTPGERKIADYILTQPEKLKTSSSQALAAGLGVSQSSVIKFAQRLGFKGFTSLKIALIEEWGQQSQQPEAQLHNDISSHDSSSLIAEKLLREKQQALRDTTDHLDYARLEQVVACIRNAGRIQIVGLGGSSLAAKDLAYKMMKLGYPVMHELDSHVQLTVAQSLGENDVQLAISFSGNLKEIVLAAGAAQKNGAKVVAITSLQESPLRKMADYTLDTLAEESRWRSSSIAVRTAQNTVTDLLFVCLLQEDAERSQRLIRRSKDMIEQLES